MNNNESYLSIVATLFITNYITDKIMNLLDINEKYKKTKFFIKGVIFVIIILTLQNIQKLLIL
ncbi:hypothetical protein [Clostridium culturomicium]|uniref:hypothetical protein n=1 Tax=Clostridium culturomicium TaxID=1499683 RepID=UPI00058EE69C|nr:hypothetical protein [Clostridium culturomicium]